MNKLRLIIVAVLLPLLASAQTGKKDFVKGADVGFLTGQERHGVQFHDRHGAVRECLELLKNDYQPQAIFLRSAKNMPRRIKTVPNRNQRVICSLSIHQAKTMVVRGLK